MDINELTLTSLQNYYKILKNTGYLENSQVYKLLLLTYIADLFDNSTSWYITEEDYILLTSIVDCLSKDTCIIPFNILPKHTEPINNYLEDTPTRISEDDIIRLSQDDVLRLYNQ